MTDDRLLGVVHELLAIAGTDRFAVPVDKLEQWLPHHGSDLEDLRRMVAEAHRRGDSEVWFRLVLEGSAPTTEDEATPR